MASLAPPDAVFRVDGDRAVPSVLARGPWSETAMHGGAPAALLAGLLEQADPGPASFVARLTVEMFRPVPLAPLRFSVTTIRPGRKVQWLQASLVTEADGVEVVRATALRLRTEDLALPFPEPEARDIAGPETSRPAVIAFDDDGPGFWSAHDLRLAAGDWAETGPATMWFRLHVPIVEGTEVSPLQRTAAAADFGNGVSTALERGVYLFINADLTITRHRDAVGEWIAVDARTWGRPEGVGYAEAVLSDLDGRFGRSVQSLLFDRL